LPQSVTFLNLSCNAAKLNAANLHVFKYLKQLWLADNNLVCPLNTVHQLYSRPAPQVNLFGRAPLRESVSRPLVWPVNKFLRFRHALHSRLQHDLPSELATLRLEQLNISSNPMTKLPAVISRMTTLKVSFSHNGHTTAFPTINFVPSMHIPDLSESNVPRPFSLLYYLYILNMLDAFCCVQTLLAHTNLMETVPDDLANLKNMTILVLSFNSFSEFPAMLCDMTQVLEPKLATRYRNSGSH
jgi:Leucine-rich repeat (LRR) protein